MTPGVDLQVLEGHIEGAAELAIHLFPPRSTLGVGRSWDFPLSRGEKVQRLIMLFEADLRDNEQREETLRREKEVADTELETLRQAADRMASCATAAAWGAMPSPPSTPPTPPLPSRVHRATAPPVPFGRRRSTVVVLPGYPSGFDPQANNASNMESEYSNIPFVDAKQAQGFSLDSACSPPRRSSFGHKEIVLEPSRGLKASPTLGATPEVARLLAEAPMWMGDDMDQSGEIGTVSAVRWGGDEVVDWIRFICDGDTCQDEAMSAANASGEFMLSPRGEFVKAIRGRAEVADGRAAEWVVVVTSRQLVTIGQPGIFTPTFSFSAEPGYELYAVTLDSSGRIAGAKQKPLANVPQLYGGPPSRPPRATNLRYGDADDDDSF
eukprot:TRINITY_DN21360_c0_g1_i2.p1 TRINITY_DN21360_c0_g1~~TRINITY_DN21360_c0_g1_i2.p1  ORF type:complete len:417 (+),score=59.75 TRINITY_DN21360_c0_g1_i2:111-1253(+)